MYVSNDLIYYHVDDIRIYFNQEMKFMYMYIRSSSSNSYGFYINKQKLYEMATEYGRQLKPYIGYTASELRNSPKFSILKRQYDELFNLYEQLKTDSGSEASIRAAFEDLTDSTLRDIPSKLGRQLELHGFPADIVNSHTLRSSDFYPTRGIGGEYDSSGYVRAYRWDAIGEGIQTTDGAEVSISDVPEWWTAAADIEDYMNSYVSSIVQKSGVPSCRARFYMYMRVNKDTLAQLKSEHGRVSDVESYASDSIPQGYAEVHASLIVAVGDTSVTYTGLCDIAAKAANASQSNILDINNILESGAVSKSLSKSTSTEWSKAINLRDYFPEECFDEDGNFDEHLATDDDWIDFNMYDLKDGFGNARKLYTTVLNKAGVPAYTEFVRSIMDGSSVDSNGNLEFVMYGDPVFEIPDIRFGFDMNISGSRARIVLAYAEVVE